MISHGDYKLKDPDALQTPAMIVFEDMLDSNIRALTELIGAANACPHVKTHKSAAVLRKQIAAGITSFKCATLRELEMSVETGAPDSILAYPLLQREKIERLASLVRAHPDVTIESLASQPEHVEALCAVARDSEPPFRVMLDVDAGFHRTGTPPGDEAIALYRSIHEHPRLTPCGLHVYDGHDHASDLAEREALAAAHVDAVKQLRDALIADGMPVPRVVGGGSFSFPYYAREDGMLGSPGTVVYWDAGYGTMMPDMPFRPAAMVLTQVIDRHPAQGTVTLDLGSKAIAADPPPEMRVRLMGRADATLVQQSEEHAIMRIDSAPPNLGDYLFAVPMHVCPTTIRYPGSHVINADGDVVAFWEHTARDH